MGRMFIGEVATYPQYQVSDQENDNCNADYQIDNISKEDSKLPPERRPLQVQPSSWP